MKVLRKQQIDKNGGGESHTSFTQRDLGERGRMGIEIQRKDAIAYKVFGKMFMPSGLEALTFSSWRVGGGVFAVEVGSYGLWCRKWRNPPNLKVKL